LSWIEIDLTQISGRITIGFVVKMRRLRIAALAAGSNRFGLNSFPKFDDRNEAVSTRAIHPLRTAITIRAKRRDGAPNAGCETDRCARPAVCERMDNVIRDALEAVDLAPRRFPASKICGQFV